jgi:putative CocE/NonD family hydrolase
MAEPARTADLALRQLEDKLRRLVQLTQTLEAENRQLRQTLRSSQTEAAARADELVRLRADLTYLRSGAVTLIERPQAQMRGELDALIAALDQTLTQYRQLRDRGTDVAMTIGPWTHEQMGTAAGGTATAETLAWLGTHLAKKPGPQRAEPVRVFITGRNRDGWVDLPDWPPATAAKVLYLRTGGRLESVPSTGGSSTFRDKHGGTSTFRYNPADPTPTVGGRLLARPSGYTDDTDLARRADVLSFTSAPLGAEMCVCGSPVVDLAYETDNDHFDVFVRISEVDARGRSRNVSDGFRRFSAMPNAPIRIDLDPIAHRFSAGSRIRVLIAGGCHPRFARNLGTGESVLSGQRMAGSTHTVRHGESSVLTLPVGDPG